MYIKESTINGTKCIIVYRSSSEEIDLQQLKEYYHCHNAAVFVAGPQDAKKTIKEMLKYQRRNRNK